MDKTKVRGRKEKFEEQYWYAKNILTDYFGLPEYRDVNILEIGGGENGALKYFDEMGANTYGLEISEARIQYARDKLKETGINLVHGDICRKTDVEQLPKMDLVILRDVIEHVKDKRATLSNIWDVLSMEGKFFLSFPPKYSAYAGHQQTIPGKFRKIPFMHLLPRPLYRSVLTVVADSKVRREALLERQASMISIKALEHLIRETGFTLKKHDYYMVRPCYEKRFGMTPSKTVFNKIPYLQEVCSMGALYILVK